jgi:LPXTG-motif cell wall-anchored protein
MKKFITPVLYIGFIIPLTAIAVGTEMLARTFGILPPYDGFIHTPLVILMLITLVFLGSPVLWLANMLLRYIEKPPHPQVKDHFRQSLFFYLIVIYSTSFWTTQGFTGNESDGYLLIWLGFSLLAILINYVFLFRKRNVIGK